MEIHPSARRHGVRDADLRHAVDRCVYAVDLPSDGPPRRVLFLGPDRAGNLLEVVALERDEADELAIHAMKMRPKYETLVPRKEIDG